MSDDLIREINEAVQRERLTGLWKRYHNLIFGLLAALIVIGGAIMYLSMRDEAAEQIATRHLTDGREQFNARQYEAAIEHFRNAREQGTAHAVLAALWEAKTLAKRRQPEQAADRLAEALPEAEEPYRSLLCLHGLTVAPADARFRDCREQADSAFAPVLQELAVMQHLRAGELAAARASLPQTHASDEQRRRLADVKAYIDSQRPDTASSTDSSNDQTQP